MKCFATTENTEGTELSGQQLCAQRNTINARIELEHLKLELEHRRTQHFRHFIDQYFCYKNDLVTRSGLVNWGALPWKYTISAGAEKIRLANPHKLSKSAMSQLVIKEHVVPLRVIETMLLELVDTGNLTCESIAAVLDQFVVFATITKTEDQVLVRQGLKDSMPEDWHPQTGSVFARYDKVGIRYTAKI